MSQSLTNSDDCCSSSSDYVSIRENKLQDKLCVPTLSLQTRYCLRKNICVPSKAALLILVWVFVVGVIHAAGVSTCAAAAIRVRKQFPHILFLGIYVPYTLLAIVLLLYPLSGFLADIYVGRYKMVNLGLLVLFCAFFVLSADSVILLIKRFPELKILFAGILCIGFVVFSAGLAGFEANVIQLGLDQLMEAPSQYLGLFIHWMTWCTSLGACLSHVFFTLYTCETEVDEHNVIRQFAHIMPPVFCVALVILLITSCYTRRWFHAEPGQDNPYKMVLKVLNFARKHKYPVRRSAVTYTDNYMPSRIDFAKERFGGPFTSEQVEDVKTLLRIVAVLLSLSPVFVLEVPTSYFIFPLFAQHTGYRRSLANITCSKTFVLLESGSLMHISGVVLFPVYIIFVYCVFQNRVPKIFWRLWIGILFYSIGTANMLVVDVTGHLLSKHDNNYAAQCLFAINPVAMNNHSAFFPTPLQLHWSVIISPSIILGVAPLIVHVTALEFISAQSPHSMKGLLVGVYFAIKGLCRLFSALVLLPFSFTRVWITPKLIAHPPPVSCGFGYFLFTIVVAVIGLVMFSVVAKRYKYRQREEPPYNQSIVEDIFARDNLQRSLLSLSVDN